MHSIRLDPQSSPLQPPLLKFANTWVKFTFRLLSPHFCFAKGVFDVSQVGF